MKARLVKLRAVGATLSKLPSDEAAQLRADLSGVWIDRVHARKLPRMIVLDMDSSVSPTHGDQEGTAYNGHFGCTCYHPLFVFNQFGDLERCGLRPGNVHSAHEWRNLSTTLRHRRFLFTDSFLLLWKWRVG